MATSDLISKARAGDGDAFDELIEPHRRELQVHCYRMLGSLQDAEDTLQETLLAAWRSFGGFDGRASLRTWLYRAAAAITALAEDLAAETEQLFSTGEGGAALVGYLTKPRGALAGCRLGRLAFDPRVGSDPSLRVPLVTYFDRLRLLLRDAIIRANQEDALGVDVDPDALAETICAVVQGGYVTARLSDDPDALQRACRGLLQALALAPATPLPPRKGRQ